MRIFVNQLHDPSYISAGGKPDYRSDLMAIRFASFNPILDPWVYILCRKNLLLKGCEKLKRTATRLNGGRSDNTGWAADQHSPQSVNSDSTSCASIRTAGYRSHAERGPVKSQSFADFATRQAWERDGAHVNPHPFGVDPTATRGSEEEEEAVAGTSPGPTHPGGAVLVACGSGHRMEVL